MRCAVWLRGLGLVPTPNLTTDRIANRTELNSTLWLCTAAYLFIAVRACFFLPNDCLSTKHANVRVSGNHKTNPPKYSITRATTMVLPSPGCKTRESGAHMVASRSSRCHPPSFARRIWHRHHPGVTLLARRLRCSTAKHYSERRTKTK